MRFEMGQSVLTLQENFQTKKKKLVVPREGRCCKPPAVDFSGCPRGA